MVKKIISCFNCEYYRDKTERFQKIIIKIIKSIPKSDLCDILITKKILKRDYLTNKITLSEKCKCGNSSIGYIGLTRMPQSPVCKDCLHGLEDIKKCQQDDMEEGGKLRDTLHKSINGLSDINSENHNKSCKGGGVNG